MQRYPKTKYLAQPKLLCFSIISPSILHRYSIETMEYVWSIFEGRTDLKHRKSPSLCTKEKCLKAKRRGSQRIKSHTTKNLRGSVGVRDLNLSNKEIVNLQLHEPKTLGQQSFVHPTIFLLSLIITVFIQYSPLCNL